VQFKKYTDQLQKLFTFIKENWLPRLEISELIPSLSDFVPNTANYNNNTYQNYAEAIEELEYNVRRRKDVVKFGYPIEN
jgi:hypothetical protein